MQENSRLLLKAVKIFRDHKLHTLVSCSIIELLPVKRTVTFGALITRVNKDG